MNVFHQPMRVQGWMADTQGCGFYRIALPLGALRAAGHETSMGVDIERPDIGGVRPVRPDVLIGQRVMAPEPSSLWRNIAAAPAHRRPALVYEIDDHPAEIEPHNPAYRLIRGNLDNIVWNLTVADLVTVSTPELAAWATRYNGNVMVLPNCVPASLVERGAARLVEPKPGVPIVGWAGSPTHREDWRISGAGTGVAASRWLHAGHAEMHLIGSNLDDLLDPGVRKVRTTPWAPSVPRYYGGIDFTIGLAPLADTPFNSAKSWIKILEYSALGIPWVASDVSPYRQWVQRMSDNDPELAGGLLIPPDSDWRRWARVLDQLLDDSEWRAELAKCGNEAAALWTIQTRWTLWERAYRRAMEIRDRSL